jgi:hypothetical protein
MSTLLVLGSKPDPVLPHTTSYESVACVNASGYSADRHGLPVPIFTAMSAVLTSGIDSGNQSLKALHDLQTNDLYLIPRFHKPVSLWKRTRHLPGTLKMSPAYFRMRLMLSHYRWQQFIVHEASYYKELIRNMCRGDEHTMQMVATKKPSTGIISLIIGMSLGQYDRFIMSGFNFQLTHAYAQNPEIIERGTTFSRHTPTDLQVLQRLSAIHGNIFTTEPAVNEQGGIPFL